MNWPWKKQVPIDERVESMKDRLYKEAFVIVNAICMISLIYKSWVLELGIQDTMIELLVLTIPNVYFLIRSVRLGIYADEVEIHDRVSKWSINRKSALFGLVIAFILAASFGVRSAIVYSDNSNWMFNFILVFVTSLLIYVPTLVLFSVTSNKLARSASEKASRRNSDV